MDALVHERVRKLITATDQLSRLSYAEAEPLAERFAALRTSLLQLDRALGASGPHHGIAGQVDLIYQRLADTSARATPRQRAEMAAALALASSLRDRVQAPSRPLLILQPAPVIPAIVAGAAFLAGALAAVWLWRRYA